MENTSRVIIISISSIIIFFTLSSYIVFVDATSPQNYSLIKEWGSQGTSDGQFNMPTDIAIDPSSHNIFIVDAGNNRVQVFDSNGKFITKWGTQGTGDGQFNHPSGISIDPVGNIYVLDAGNLRIEKFASDGSFLTQWSSPSVVAGAVYQSDLSVDPSGNVYFTATKENKFYKDTTDGDTITSFGSNGLGNGQFSGPTSIAVDGSNNIYVFDTNNHRIQKFVFATDASGSSSSGSIKFITKWGSQGTSDGQFIRQGGLAVDSVGNVYVADMASHRIQKFDSNGKFITKWGENGIEGAKLLSPYGLAVDSSGNVYVADMASHKIKVFAQSPSIS